MEICKRALHGILYPPELTCRRVQSLEKTYASPFPPIDTSLRSLYPYLVSCRSDPLQSGVCCLEYSDPGPTVA